MSSPVPTDYVPKVVSWTVSTLRFLRLHKVVWRARDKTILNVLRSVHHDAIHLTRRLSSAITSERNPESIAAAAAQIASTLCNRFHDAMATLLELKPNQIHCCIKLIAPKDSSEEEDKIGTWMRSEPFDGRPTEWNPERDFHAITKNTVWCAMYGVSDGTTIWKPSNCFACNDLVKHGNLFKCDRDNWQSFYRSTLVFPINHVKNAEATEFDRLGFLAFDSPEVGMFRGVPDIFDHRDRLPAYWDKMNESSAFHLGAVFADLLGTALGFSRQIQHGKQYRFIRNSKRTRKINGPDPDVTKQ